jgi:hypothetical protein
MRLAGPERELVKNSNRGAWRERVMFQKIPTSRFLETTGRRISVGNRRGWRNVARRRDAMVVLRQGLREPSYRI